MKKIKTYIALLITAWFGLYICFVVVTASFNITKWPEQNRKDAGTAMVFSMMVIGITYLIKPNT